MTLNELQFVRSLVANGSEVSLDVWRKVLQTAIDATVTVTAAKGRSHDDHCAGWLGGSCDCPNGTVSA